MLLHGRVLCELGKLACENCVVSHAFSNRVGETTNAATDVFVWLGTQRGHSKLQRVVVIVKYSSLSGNHIRRIAPRRNTKSGQ